MEVKYLNFKFLDVDEADGTFQGLASVFDVVDSYNEVVERGAFAKTLQENDGKFPLCWFHNVNEPLGIAYAREGSAGLLIDGHLNLEVQSAREKRSLMRQGAIKGLSIGFRTIRDAWDKDIRKLREIQLYEISPITLNFQACPGAEIGDVKGDSLPELLKKYMNALEEFKSIVAASEEKARRDFREMLESREEYFREIAAIHHKASNRNRR